jgi:hypothetical protein
MTDLLVRLPAMVSDTSGEFIGTTAAPPSGDRIELTDLEVIQRWSLAVRGASADRKEVVAALRADLAWLERGASPTPRTAASAPASAPARTPVRTPTRTPPRTPPRTAAKKTTKTAKKSAKKSAARGGARRR